MVISSIGLGGNIADEGPATLSINVLAILLGKGVAAAGGTVLAVLEVPLLATTEDGVSESGGDNGGVAKLDICSYPWGKA